MPGNGLLKTEELGLKKVKLVGQRGEIMKQCKHLNLNSTREILLNTPPKNKNDNIDQETIDIQMLCNLKISSFLLFLSCIN